MYKISILFKFYFSENENGPSSNKATTNVQMPTTTKSPAAFDLLGLDTSNGLSTSNNLVDSKDSTHSLAQKLPAPLCANGISTKMSTQLDLLCMGEGMKYIYFDMAIFLNPP